MLDITFNLRKGNSIFFDGSYRIASGKEEIKDAISSVSQTTELTSSTINLGLGFSAFYQINLVLSHNLITIYTTLHLQ